jgi:prevent-host-death family protein
MTNMGSRSRKSTFNVAEAKARFSSLVRRAAAGEEIVIARDNKPVLKLVSLSTPGKPRKPGSARGKVRISRDFDRVLSDFDDYS